MFLHLILYSTITNRIQCENFSDTPTDTIKWRLPNNTVPLSYTLWMAPRLNDNFEFLGNITIKIKVKLTSRVIYLHCKGLDIISVQISKRNTKFFPSINSDPMHQLLRLELHHDMVINSEYYVHISYRGFLRDDIGFIRKSYHIGDEVK